MEYLHTGYKGVWSLRLCSRLCSVASVVGLIIMLYSTYPYHRQSTYQQHYINRTLQGMWDGVATLLLNAEPNTKFVHSYKPTAKATTLPVPNSKYQDSRAKISQWLRTEITTVALRGKHLKNKQALNSSLDERKQLKNIKVAHSPQPRRYLCPFEGGRMGNMLFNYASTYCIAKKVNMNLIIPKKYKLLKYFNLTPRPVSEIPYLGICSTTKNQNLRRVRVKVAAKYANISMPVDNDVILYGYLQSWKYFNECKDDIRHQLSFKDKNIYVTADLRLKQAMGQLNNQSKGTSTNHTIVGIHVRRGDFVKYSPTGSKTYFQKARDFYRKLYKNAIFVIITDSSNESRSWCLENIVKGSQDTLLLDSSDVIIDLATMWACDHSIISVGTFSWWTAWMNHNNGNVVYYLGERWRNKNGDFVLPNWIGLTD